MKQRLTLGLLLGMTLGVATSCRAVVQVSTPAPNSVGYLLDTPPPDAGVPSSYLEKFTLPATVAIPDRREVYWLYVTAPQHLPGDYELRDLSRRGPNNVAIPLVQNEEVGGLD